MVFQRKPLKTLVEEAGVDWEAFVRIASLHEDDRPSYRSAGIFWDIDERTAKAWLKRWDEGERGEP